MEAATIAQLSASLSSIITSLGSLPPSLLNGIDVQQLNTTFLALSNDVGPVLLSLGQIQQDALLMNTTWLAHNLQSLGGLVSSIPAEDRVGISRTGLAQLVYWGSYRYDVLTVWIPDVWGVLLVYMIAIITKFAREAMVNRKAISLVKNRLSIERGLPVTDEEATFILTKSSKAVISHALNLVMATISLSLQLSAWRLLVVPATPLRVRDGQLLYLAVKMLVIAYGCEMLFADIHFEIYVHHVVTYSIIFFGAIVNYYTKSSKTLRFCQWILLQATLEQPEYLSMTCYHFSTYLRVQGIRPKAQRTLLATAWTTMTITKYITYPQRLLPVAFAAYWLVRMWKEMHASLCGRAWLGFCTTLIICLVAIQVKFCDDIPPLCDHIYRKLHHPEQPPKKGMGPLTTFVLRCLGKQKKRAVKTQELYEASSGSSEDTKEV